MSHTLEELCNRLEIQQLLGTCCHALDGAEAELFESLWHPDAVWEFVGREGARVEGELRS